MRRTPAHPNPRYRHPFIITLQVPAKRSDHPRPTARQGMTEASVRSAGDPGIRPQTGRLLWSSLPATSPAVRGVECSSTCSPILRWMPGTSAPLGCEGGRSGSLADRTLMLSRSARGPVAMSIRSRRSTTCRWPPAVRRTSARARFPTGCPPMVRPRHSLSARGGRTILRLRHFGLDCERGTG